MKKRLLSAATLLFSITSLSGCDTTGEKTASLSVIYIVCAVISLLLLAGCLFLVNTRKKWVTLLFSSVLVVNIGYTLLSFSANLSMALMSNRIAYLGSVFLPLAMLMIILDVTGTRHKKYLPVSLFILSVIVFLIAASPGILPIYYKEVSFEVINGVSTLIKVYGPLHPIYLVYLLGYFTAMVVVILRSIVKKTVETVSHAVILLMAVFVNIGVWFIEQLVSVDFEMLSISYIISELFLLGVHIVMNENRRLKELVMQKEEALAATEPHTVSAETKEAFLRGLDTLTPTERVIYEAYTGKLSTKEVMSKLSITENTLKFHNKNLYGKLGVSSRKKLLEIHEAIKKDN